MEIRDVGLSESSETQTEISSRLAKIVPRQRHFDANTSLSDMASSEFAMSPSETRTELIISIKVSKRHINAQKINILSFCKKVVQLILSI